MARISADTPSAPAPDLTALLDRHLLDDCALAAQLAGHRMRAQQGLAPASDAAKAQAALAALNLRATARYRRRRFQDVF